MATFKVNLGWTDYQPMLKHDGVVARSQTPFHPINYVIKNSLYYHKFKVYLTQCSCEYDESVYLGGRDTLEEAKRLCEVDFDSKIADFIVIEE